MPDEYILRSIAIAKLTALEVTDPFATIADAKRVLADMAAADVAPVVHGKWVHSRHDRSSEQFEVVKCSRCGLEAYAMAYHVRDGNYCPRCGARMDGGTENDP